MPLEPLARLHTEDPLDIHERETLPPPPADENDPHERETMPANETDERETMPSNGSEIRKFDTAAEGFFVVGEAKSALYRAEAEEDARAWEAETRRRTHAKWVMGVMAGCAAVLVFASAHIG